MKTFKQLINEVFNLLSEDVSMEEAFGRAEISFINLLHGMKSSAAGSLFGECLNIFTSTDITEIEILVAENDMNIYTFGTYAIGNTLEHKMPIGKKAIYVTKKDIENLCSVIDKQTMVNNIIKLENHEQTFSFSSTADPAPHIITDKMFNTREEMKDVEHLVKSKLTGKLKTVTKREPTGIFIRNGNLTLETIFTGKGISTGKKVSSMEVDRSGRKTAAIKNKYYINNRANLFIKFKDKQSYLVCIDKNNSNDKLNANFSSGSINNVAIFKTIKNDNDLFYNTSFLNKAAEKLSLNLAEINKILNNKQNVANRNIIGPQKSQKINKRVGNNLSKDLKDKIAVFKTIPVGTPAYKLSLDKLWNSIISERENLNFTDEEWRILPSAIKEVIKKRQQYRNKQERENRRFFRG